MKITTLPKESTVIEIGDFILVKEMVLRVIKDSGDYLSLIHMEKPETYKHDLFNHEVHILNHIKKHYGTNFEIVKSKDVELVIKG